MAHAFPAARWLPRFSRVSVDLPFQTYSLFLTLEPSNYLYRRARCLAVLLRGIQGGALLSLCSSCYQLALEQELADFGSLPLVQHQCVLTGGGCRAVAPCPGSDEAPLMTAVGMPRPSQALACRAMPRGEPGPRCRGSQGTPGQLGLGAPLGVAWSSPPGVGSPATPAPPCCRWSEGHGGAV